MADYSSTTTKNLYQAGIWSEDCPWEKTPEGRACGWVEAENMMAVWRLVEDWFLAMEDGTADSRYPDPNWAQPGDREPLSQELADRIIEEMEEDFLIEERRMLNMGKKPPEFSRLAPHARMAFAQQIYAIMKPLWAIREEAKERAAAGESLPPRD